MEMAVEVGLVGDLAAVPAAVHSGVVERVASVAARLVAVLDRVAAVAQFQEELGGVRRGELQAALPAELQAASVLELAEALVVIRLVAWVVLVARSGAECRLVLAAE